MAGERWIFTPLDLENTPSRKSGIDFDKELSYRQQAANLMQDMGQRLQVPQLAINTSIVYMQRFYMFHSFQKFHRNHMAAACLFLAAKVEEQPRKLEHVIKVAHMCLHRDQPPLDTKSTAYLEQAQELVINENILLQTLGFDITVDHPHSHVVRTCTLVKATKDLAQTSYFLATNSLHLTTLCLQVQPKVVACICIYLACKWANWEIPRSSEGKYWYQYVDTSITPTLLEELAVQFVQILDKCPSKLKKKLMTYRGGETDLSLDRKPSAASTSDPSAHTSSAHPSTHPSHTAVSNTFTNHDRKDAPQPPPASAQRLPPPPGKSQPQPKPQEGGSTELNPGLRRVKTESCALSTKEYMERKERERQERERLLRERQQFDKERRKSEKGGAPGEPRASQRPPERPERSQQARPAPPGPDKLKHPERHHLDILGKLSDDKAVDIMSEEIEKSMKEKQPLPPLPDMDRKTAEPSIVSRPSGEGRVTNDHRHSDKRPADSGSSSRHHDSRSRHGHEQRPNPHKPHRQEEPKQGPAPPHPGQPTSKRERKNSARALKSPLTKDLQSPYKQPEVTLSPYSEMKLKIKLPVDPALAAVKKEDKELKLKIKSPTPPTVTRTSEPEKKELKLKLSLKHGKSETITHNDVVASSEPGADSPAPMKLVLSKDKSGHYSSGHHHHKHKHSSSHHRHSSGSSGEREKRKRNHSPGDGRHAHKVSRSASTADNGHHPAGGANDSRSANPFAVMEQLNKIIEAKKAQIQEQVNNTPPLPPGDLGNPPPPPREPPPRPPLPPPV